MKKIISLVALSLMLSACAPALFLAGAATGGLVVYDRRNIQTVMKDTRCRNDIVNAISKDPAFEHSHIVVSSFHGSVLLAGQTPLASLRVRAEKIARQQPDIGKIYNEITVSSPSSTLTRSNDTWITTKVKTQMIANKDLRSSDIKVVTESGSVFLLGKVSRTQASVAVDVARRVSGVQRIVKAFEYV